MSRNVNHNSELHRFEITVDGELAGTADYTLENGTYSINHTNVFDRFGGAGVGTTLVLGALEKIRDDGGRVLPNCPFVPKVMNEHPEFIALVPEDARSRFNL